MKLGRYTLLRRLAVGGMAELYRARRDEDGLEVALKLVLPQHAHDPAFIQMLMDEARLARELDHPGLVRVLDHGQEAGQAFLAMELVLGPSLAALLDAARRTGRALSPGIALRVARDLLEALRYLHGLRDAAGASLEVVHRDVTPGNVLIEARSGQVRLGDFGIAQHRLRQARTRTGVIKGTVQYMAPEQVTGSGIDARTDLYGVGLMLFELLTLRPFVEAERELDLLRLVEDPGWRAPSSLRPELSPVLDALCRRALRRFPEERYPDARAFLAALEQAEATLPSRTGAVELAALCAELATDEPPASTADTMAMVGAVPTLAASAVAPVPSPTRARRLPAMAILVGVAALGSGLFAWWRIREPKHPLPTRVALDAGPRLAVGLERAADGSATRSRPDSHRGADRPGSLDAPRRKRVIRVAVRPRIDAGRPAVPGRSVERGSQLRRLQAARSLARSRGILADDLPAALAGRLRRAEEALAGAGDPASIGPEVATLEAELGALRVSRELVEAKLRRVDALLKRRGGAAPRALRDAAAQALQAFMDRRYAEANQELNAILEGR